MKYIKKIGLSILVITLLVTSKQYHISTNAEENTTNAQIKTIKSITLNKTIIDIRVKKKTIITPHIEYNAGGEEKEGYFWHSNNKMIATINSKGIIKGKSIGSTYIICQSKSGLVKARCKIIVRKPYKKIKAISFNRAQIAMNKNDKRKLTPVIKCSGKKKYTTEPVEWYSSNNKIVKVTKDGILKARKNGTATISVRSKFTGHKAKIRVKVAKTKYVAFTFDDGPGKYTEKLLSALKKYNSKATFFVVGNRAAGNKSILKKEAAAGMEIGNHSYTHANLKKLSKKQIVSEIEKTNNVVKSATGAKPTVLRPPYGNYNKKVSKASGVPMIYWSVDTLDWKYKNTKKVCKYILRNTGKWDIVLLHDIHKTSVEGFIKALPTLKKQGYELVTVTELFEIYGKKMKNGVMYYNPPTK